MSSQDTGEDLIDFEVGSPDLPQGTLTTTSRLLDPETVPETLLDSELLRLEETLQTASSSPLNSRSRCDSRDSVELEQILITIDDGNLNSSEVSSRLNACSSRRNSSSLDVNNALEELDKIINESTNAELDEIDGDYNVEDCLRELDIYLQGFDTSGSDAADVETADVEARREQNQLDIVSTVGVSQGEQDNATDFSLTDRLRRLASHTRSLRYGRMNPGYESTESGNHFEGRRPASADCTQEFKRNNQFRATIATNSDYTLSKGYISSNQVGRMKGIVSDNKDELSKCGGQLKRNASDIPELKGCNGPSSSGKRFAFDLQGRASKHASLPRKPGLDGRPFSADWGKEFKRNHQFRSTISSIPYVQQQPEVDNETDDEEIDWSWMQDVPQEEASVEEPPVRGQSAWLRSSMRRVRHFRLPSDPASGAIEPVVSSSSTPSVLPASDPTAASTARPVLPNQPAPRPVSAPVRGVGVVSDGAARPRSGSESSRSRSRPRSLSSSESSLASSVDSTPSCTPVATPVHQPGAADNTAPSATAPPRRPCDTTTPGATMPEARSPLGQWPHGLSSMLACLGCTLGLFNVSRFAILTVRFGANFIVQFLILSLVFGVPLFTLQLCLGQQLGAGVVDMWRISPLFQGVGIALLIAQALIGLYSIVGVSWMFIYFRDSFITKQDQYRWAEPYQDYREDSRSGLNGTYKISETVPDYFNGIVLQRHGLVSGNSFGAIKFQVAFNLAVVWMIVFVSLSKGLRSYAKVVYVFTLLPIFGTFVLCAKLLGMTPSDSLHEVFPETSWAEFFLNSKSWIAASQEAFLTWGLLGAAVMQLSSHNKHKHLLQRDSSLVIILTITILMLTAFLANTCIEILHFYGYNYMPNSFEQMSTYIFLRSTKEPLPPSLSSTPVRYMTHSSFIIGERVVRPGMDKTVESGYQVLRFATELVPATLALLGPTQISPFWAVLFYFILILFGIAQQLAIWHCVITGIMAIRAKVLKSWETTITFFTCTFGFILGLPMTTEFGIVVVYFLDYIIGGAWWLIFVYLLQIVAVFMVRGRPYSGDTVVTALFNSTSGSCVQAWLAPLLSFTWNVILPVALMVVCITLFKSGSFKELFVWHHAPSLEYWPTWARQIGSLLQLMPILCIPVVAIIQSYRYLNNGPPDILDRIQLLYRPPLDSEHLDDLTIHQAAAATANTTTTTATNIPAEDPPPKYTPPPSYTTATGARIAKMLRQSIRRSVRRLANVLGESSTPRTVDRPHLQVPPPDYSAVLVEMNQSGSVPQVAVDVTDCGSRISRELSSLQGSPLTAADVASILRSSFRRSTIRNATRMRRSAPEEIPSGSLSAECLVDGVAPLGQDSLVLDTISSHANDSESKPDDNRFSVI